MIYDVINLDSIGNNKDGYEVNDAHFTGKHIELPESASVLDIMRALKAADIMANFVNRNHIVVENEDGDSLYIRSQKGMWLWELRPCKSNNLNSD